ncbi:hypothetical protein GX50_02048 [[Emmonsia] crescens]|uniref:Uncharacterized protein n=1 Tax=[Emmonsia] crescens TaxID=73230 RepID=A0A2B7ZMB4_9EURO|nr:hypothetical protein GX50_02048 [Emmonsia crescens]
MAYYLLDILSEPNLDADSTNSALDPNTINSAWAPVTGYKKWADFTYETLISCYGDVLRRSLTSPFPGISPPLSRLQREIWDENSLCHFLSRTIMPTVGAALQRGWTICYPGNDDPIDIATGRILRHGHDSSSS